MTRSSPGVARVVAILNFIAQHPGQSFTLTDLVRALKLSRATCHALLAGLVDADYLYRTSDKSYVLGPALAKIGRAANAHFSPLQAAQPEMRALADEFDAVCSALSRDRNDVIVRDRATSRSHLGWPMPPNARLPLRPPFGGAFLAWSPEAEADAWLDQLQPPAPVEFRQLMHQGMAFAREHGFQVVVRAVGQNDHNTEWFYGEARVDPPVLLAQELKPEESYRLAGVTAPVFEAGGRIAFLLGLTGFQGEYTGAQVERIGARLVQACRHLTAFAGGETA